MDIERVGTKASLTIPARHTTRASRANSSNGFQNILAKEKMDQYVARLNESFSKIKEQGIRLAENRTLKELQAYKALVKGFVKEVVDEGLDAKQQSGFNRRGQSKTYLLVQEVDQKLLDLSRDILEAERPHLHILQQVGQIEGLLVNLYG
ncbi:YaaR family protein [Geomicrobium sp. JSM 1781026]|uniref:YaaR family protein n=1 Tax=Geomicrobium sp. JSM 1781026 TaxID=3344580 RepID=UPI0035BF8620